MRSLGLVFIATALLIPLYWFYELATLWDLLPIVSQYFGVAALIVMGLIQLLATRLACLEFVFGSLDRIYILHKWMGIAALALMMLHDTIDAETDGNNGGWLRDFGESLGGTSLDFLRILILASIILLIPYRFWKWSHKFMGAFFICGVLHFIWIDKPFDNSEPLAVYTLFFCVVGVLSYFYTLLPETWFKRYRNYQVCNIEQAGGALAITLKPQGKRITYSAGQFAFVKFEQPTLQEIHPFTISQAPKPDGSLRFTIKNLGDYTQSLHFGLQNNIKVKVQGAFGHFTHQNHRATSVWAATGIGITPFVAMAQALESCDTPIHLFYCIRSESEAPHLDELKDIAEKWDNFHLHLFDCSKSMRLSGQDVLNVASPKDMRCYFCGSKILRESLSTELFAAGLSKRRFHYEAFEIRSGIGLDRVIRFFFGKLMNLRRT